MIVATVAKLYTTATFVRRPAEKDAVMDVETLERVREVVAVIPAVSVLAYGDVAARAGLPGRARLVGRILAEDGQDLPWHRVLRADGSPAPHLAAEQLSRLRAEGVLAGNGRVPIRRCRAPEWHTAFPYHRRSRDPM
jgi:methylated-DNA-protein-cysteine methyltransferase related protein